MQQSLKHGGIGFLVLTAALTLSACGNSRDTGI